MHKQLVSGIFLVVIAFGLGWLVNNSYTKEKTKDRSGTMLYQEQGEFDPDVSSILAVKVTQETPKSLFLEVEYNYAENDVGKSQIFVLPDMPYWAQRPVYVRPGRHNTTVVIDLNYTTMEKKGLKTTTSTYLTASIEGYTENKYLGRIESHQIPFKKVWALDE